MDNAAGEPLIERSPGGKGGGGSRLTETGRQLIRVYREAESSHQRLAEQLAKEVRNPHRFLELARNISFRSSARNQFFATIRKVPQDPGVTLIDLNLGERIKLRASVTREAIDALELAPGNTVLTLVKASAVLIRVPAPSDRADSAVNVMKGKVKTRTDAGTPPQFQVSVTKSLTIWGVGETGSKLQQGDAAECLIPCAAVLLVLPSESN